MYVINNNINRMRVRYSSGSSIPGYSLPVDVILKWSSLRNLCAPVLIDVGSPRLPSPAIARLPATDFRGVSAADFGRMSAALRVDSSSAVVVGSANPLLAAKLWWLYTIYGLPSGARVIDRWPERVEEEEKSGNDTVAGTADRSWTPSLIEGSIATASDVMTASSRGLQLIDVRTAAEYEGLDVRGGASRGGHVPGAVNVPWSEFLDPSSGSWRDAVGLQRVFQKAGVDYLRPSIVYCQSGMRATACVLALRAAGAPTLAANYEASMHEWLADESLPVVTGPAPGPTLL